MSSHGKFAGKGPLTRGQLNWLFGRKVGRPDKECWALTNFVVNTMSGHGWRMRHISELCEFSKEYGFSQRTHVMWRKWYAQANHQEGQTVEECAWPVCERRGDAVVWTWFKHSMQVADWVPITDDCPFTKTLVPFKNGYFKAVPIEEPHIQWDAAADARGTCFQAYFPTDNFQETVAKLITASGQQDSFANEQGCKCTIDFMGTWRGQPFTLYDYKFDECVHIGGREQLDVQGLCAELEKVLEPVVPTPYKTYVHSFEA